MWSMLPNEAMYPYTAKEARDRGELELWRANFRTNCACAGAIELAIHRDFDGMYLKDGCAKSVIDQYGYKRVQGADRGAEGDAGQRQKADGCAEPAGHL